MAFEFGLRPNSIFTITNLRLVCKMMLYIVLININRPANVINLGLSVVLW